MKRIWLLIIGIVVVVAIVILNVTRGKAGQEVEIAEAHFGNITSTVEATGTLSAKIQVNVSAEALGRVKKVYVKEGDIVKKGARLLQLQDEQASASTMLAKARYEQAKLLFNRTQNLQEKNLISQEEFEAVRTNHEVAKAQYLQAQDNLAKTRIDAPISGKVMKVNIEEGETVILGTMNNPGTVLITIADMSRMIATVKVDETDIPNIKNRMTAKVTADALPDTSFKGFVTKVGLMPLENLLSTETAINFEVEVEMSDFSAELRPGMTVKAEIITSQKDSVLVVPVQSVGKRKVKGKETSTVLLYERNKAALKEITTGVSNDTDIEIKSGVKPGDQVITGPYRIVSKLKDGSSVKIAKGEKTDSTRRRNSIRALRRATR